MIVALIKHFYSKFNLHKYDNHKKYKLFSFQEKTGLLLQTVKFFLKKNALSLSVSEMDIKKVISKFVKF